MEDDVFKNRLICRWEELRETLISAEAFNENIDQIDEQIRVGMERNHSTWPEDQLTIDLNWASTNSYVADVATLKQWISDRIDWMDQELASIKETYIKKPVKLYPNPTADHRFNVSYFLESATAIQFQIYDISGKAILSGSVAGEKGTNTLEIQNFHAGAGMYLFELVIGEERFVYKLVRL